MTGHLVHVLLLDADYERECDYDGMPDTFPGVDYHILLLVGDENLVQLVPLALSRDRPGNAPITNEETSPSSGRCVITISPV